MMSLSPLRILAVDVGGGTQDVLVYDSDREIENCFKMVLPAQTQIVAARIRKATAAGRSIYLAGSLMGGGASGNAIEEHLAAGLPVSSSGEAARTVHNDLDRVRKLGIEITSTPPPDAEVIWLRDIDLEALALSLAAHEIAVPEMYAIAVQDHGYLPGSGGREFRSEFLSSLLENGGEVTNMVYREPPEYMIRMRTVARDAPRAFMMDTGAAAVLGSLGDARIAEHVLDHGGILVNIGNLHTFAVAMRGGRIYGLFEHHTGGVTPAWLHQLVERLKSGSLTHAEVKAHGGHGAAFSSEYAAAGPFQFVAVTGPNRRIAAPLGYYQAAPHGDMMLTGSYGLVEGVMRTLTSEGHALPVSSLIH
jgi:uncharacterized protein (DUF1786 family)